MSYTPTTWQTGDTITAEKLNNMESGIEAANETLVIHAKFDMGWALKSVDCSAADAEAAVRAGKNVVVLFQRYDGIYLQETKTAQRSPWTQYGRIGFFVESQADSESSTSPPVLEIEGPPLGWATSSSFENFYPNASFELGYDRSAFTGSMIGRVFGFDHMDPHPYWRPVNERITFGSELDSLIAGAMQAATAAGGKATLSISLPGDMAEVVGPNGRNGFIHLDGGCYVVQANGSYYKGAIALTTRMHIYDNDSTGEYTDMQTGTFQIPVWSTSGGTYSIDTMWIFTLSLFTKMEIVSDENTYFANIVLTAEKITPTQV